MYESMRKPLLTMFFAVAFIGAAMAQTTTVSGKVTGADDGLPLPQVSVLLKGTAAGVPTNIDGEYRIDVPAGGGTLIFRYLGYVTQEIEIGSRNVIDVQMVPETLDAGEVVVVGYGTQSKALLTDNLAKIGAADMKEIPTSGFQNALVAKAPGVQITQINGKVEGSVKVIIRGLSSVSGSQEPLYIIDGIELNNTNSAAGGPANLNPMLSLNPNDIESVQILKDASAAAIYGARGTNGVILITTKRGKKGQASISLNVSSGISRPTRLREWLNASQYRELLTEAYKNRTGDSDEKVKAWVDKRLKRYQGDQEHKDIDTDWQNEAFQKGYMHDVSVSISAGNDKTTSFLSFAGHDNKGIIRGNHLKRYTARANIENKISEKLKAGINLNFSETKIDRISNDNAFTTPLQAIAQVPTSPALLKNGDPNDKTLYANFLLQDRHSFTKSTVRRTLGKMFGELGITPELSFRSEVGLDLFARVLDQNTGRLAPFQSTKGQSYAVNVKQQLLSTNNYFTFGKNLGETGNLSVVAGMNFTRNDRRNISVTGQGFPTDEFKSISSAAKISAGTGEFTAWSQLSGFMRATYSYKDKYILKGSIRRDGNSVFGKKRRFGNFPALSVAWRASEEGFLQQVPTVSDLKLRASWGMNGNAPTDNFLSLGLFDGGTYNASSTLVPSQAENTELKWEQTAQINIGLDFGFLDNRITGSVDYYQKNTSDLLFPVQTPQSALVPGHQYQANIGSLTNKGFEFILSTTNLQKEDLTWKTTLNFSTNNNKVLSLPKGNDIITGRNILREGESVNAFYLVEYAGVDPKTGDALYVKNTKKADGTLDKGTTNKYNEAKRVIAGSPIPQWMGGLTSTLTYKNIDFSFTLQGQWGASVYNGGGQYQETGFGNGLDNQTIEVMNRWQKPGDVTNVPRAVLFRNNGHSHSTRYLWNANFIRLRNVALGYTLPSKITEKINIKTLRLYLTGLNLLTFTEYRGYDPESTSDAANTNRNMGSSFYSAPAARVFTLGINVTF